MRAGDSYFEPHIETIPRDRLEALQERRLRSILPQVYRNSGLIRQVWEEAGITPDDIQTLDDFRTRVPFIDKDRIRRFRDENNDPYGGIKIVPDGHVHAVGFTSGTTGDPTPVPFGRASATETQSLRDYWHIGARPGDFVTHFLFTFRGGQSRLNWHNGAGWTAIMGPHDPAELPGMIEAIRKYRPTILYMLSTPMMIGLEKYFESTNVDPREIFSSIKGAVFGGEPLSPRFKRLAGEWGLEIFEYSTFGDVCGAMECRMHDGLHGWEDIGLVENLDDDGNPVPDGEVGEMVVTALEDPIAPLIRYRTEDLIRLDRSTCGCGRTHARFWPLGRKGDRTIVQGKAILPRDIQSLIELHRETRACLFQIIRPQEELEMLRLRVGYDVGATPDVAALKSRLDTELAGLFAVPSEVELVPEEDLLKLGPPQKIPRVTKQ